MPELQTLLRSRRAWRLAPVLVALAFGVWGAWRVVAGDAGDARAQLRQARALVARQGTELEQLRQQVTTLRRSDQISREANRDLQGSLAEREEEIAGLRADVMFYERLVGATGQRRGLAVHALHIQQQSPGVWHFTSTLTQNLNRGGISAGTLTLSVEGSRNGRLQTLDWPTLRQQPGAPGVPFSFRYFQQVEGDLFLPPGLRPARVTVRLAPRSGARIEQAFSWLDATRDPG